MGASQPTCGPVWQQVRDTDATKDSRDTYMTPMAVEANGRTEIVICGGEFMTAATSGL